MGLSKSSLYQGFGGKKRLFELCMGRYCDKLVETLQDRLSSAESGRHFIEGLLSTVADVARDSEQRTGCLIMNTASEFAQSDPSVAQWVSGGMRRIKEVFLKAVRQGQGDGDICGDMDADVLADYLISSMGGLNTVAKGGADEQTIRGIVSVILRALD